MQSDYDNAVRIYNAYSTPGNPTDIAISEAELEIARQAFEDAKDGPDPDALALAQARVDNALAQVAAAAAALQEIQLIAPLNGSIGQLRPCCYPVVNSTTATTNAGSRWRIR